MQKSGVIMEAGVPQKSELSTGPWGKIDRETSPESKAAIARAALKEFASRPVQQPQSVYERMQQEAGQKKEMLARQQTAKRNQQLPQSSSVNKKPGSAFTHKKLRKKQTGMETKINIKAG